MDNLPQRLQGINFKVTSTIADRAAALSETAHEIINLATARPNFDTPEAIKKEAVEALVEAKTYMVYTESRGLPLLREVVGDKLQTQNQVAYDSGSEILITAGTHEALFLALQALIDVGDEVLLIDPSWVAYHGMIKLAMGTPVYVGLTEDFRLDVEVLRAAVSPKTKAIMFANPNNPSGTVFLRDELEQLGAVAQEHNLFVIVDEIYEPFIFNGCAHMSIASLPGMRERTITINGCSKAYAMTGWRIGYAAAPQEVISRMLLVHQHLISAPCSFAQRGAVAAFTHAKDSYKPILDSFRYRRDRLVELLREIPGVRFHVPDGACFLFPAFDGIALSGQELSVAFAEKVGVLFSPGESFGPSGAGRIRLSFASLPDSQVEEVVHRIGVLLEMLRHNAAVIGSD